MWALGEYTFCVASDDGARLWVDGRQIVNYWNSRAVGSSCCECSFLSNTKRIVCRHFYMTSFGFDLSWTTYYDCTCTVSEISFPFRTLFYSLYWMARARTFSRYDCNWILRRYVTWSAAANVTISLIDGNHYFIRLVNHLIWSQIVASILFPRGFEVSEFCGTLFNRKQYDCHAVEQLESSTGCSMTPFVQEYYEQTGVAEVYLRWSGPGVVGNLTIPASNLEPGSPFCNVESQITSPRCFILHVESVQSSSFLLIIHDNTFFMSRLFLWIYSFFIWQRRTWQTLGPLGLSCVFDGLNDFQYSNLCDCWVGADTFAGTQGFVDTTGSTTGSTTADSSTGSTTSTMVDTTGQGVHTPSTLRHHRPFLVDL